MDGRFPSIRSVRIRVVKQRGYLREGTRGGTRASLLAPFLGRCVAALLSERRRESCAAVGRGGERDVAGDGRELERDGGGCGGLDGFKVLVTEDGGVAGGEGGVG